MTTTLSDRGVAQLDGAEVQPLPLIVLAPGDGYGYRVGAFPVTVRNETRILFVFGGDSGAETQLAYLLDQPAHHLGFDTFVTLFKTESLMPRHLLVGWLAMRALFGHGVRLIDLDSFDIRQFDRMTNRGACGDIIERLNENWTDQLTPLRLFLGLI